RTLKKYLDESCNHGKTICTRTYRLLVKYKQEKDSSTLGLKEQIPINGNHEKEDISKNENDDSRKKKQLNIFPSKIESGHIVAMRNKSRTFETKKYTHLEKKIFKELDYTDFLKKNNTISDKIYKKIVCRKYGLRVVLPLLIFLFLLIIFIVDVSFGFAGKHSLLHELGLNKGYLNSLTKEEPWSSILVGLNKFGLFLKHTTTDTVGAEICAWCDKTTEVTNYCVLGHFFRILIHFVPFIILSITIISGIIYYHKKVKKYEKIKFRKI
ncbi:Plasmodium exported protein (Pm-fam-a like), unknown function, partial [Plasmodium malariae]